MNQPATQPQPQPATGPECVYCNEPLTAPALTCHYCRASICAECDTSTDLDDRPRCAGCWHAGKH